MEWRDWWSPSRKTPNWDLLSTVDSTSVHPDMDMPISAIPRWFNDDSSTWRKITFEDELTESNQEDDIHDHLLEGKEEAHNSQGEEINEASKDTAKNYLNNQTI